MENLGSSYVNSGQALVAGAIFVSGIDMCLHYDFNTVLKRRLPSCKSLSYKCVL